MALAVRLAGLTLKNPVMTASGTFGYGLEFAQYLDLSSLGAIVVKGLSLNPKPGNPTPRIVETASGMLNSIGLQNIGAKAFVKDKLPKLQAFDTHVIANFFGDTVSEYVACAEFLANSAGISALEMNVSCPNKQAGWIAFGTDPKTLENLVKEVRKVCAIPLIVKLSPNVTDIALMAKVAEASGADAVSLVNTFSAMVIDIYKRKPVLANNVGGLSGPAIKPIAIKMVWDVYKAVKIPIIGIGGIMSGADAVEFIIAGATAVAVGTGNFVNPSITLSIISEIREYLQSQKIEDINELIGSLQLNTCEPLRCEYE